MKLLIACLALLLILCPISQARAHALDPGYLQLQTIGNNTWRVFWRKPAVAGQPMPIGVILPKTCDRRKPPKATFDGTAWLAQWIAICPGGLAGGVITIPGLAATQTDVLVRYETDNHAGQTLRLSPVQPSVTVPVNPGFFDVPISYIKLGIGHILEGVDHLLFVFALLLLIPNRRRLLGAITAFTVAHSITLAAATLGWVHLPSPPVEAMIALSIMFLASELLQRSGGGDRMSERAPWVVSFSFGLLHGFGFAGALQDIGLPSEDLPVALVSFNVGVEIGQLMFIGAVLAIGSVIAWVAPRIARAAAVPHGAIATINAYAIGGISAYWLLDRLSLF